MILDEFDHTILKHLQINANISMDELGAKINLSRNAAWRRVKLMTEAGIIKRTIAVVDAEKIGCGLTALVFVRTSHHEKEWLEKFSRAAHSIANIVEAYRMSGDLDYMLKVRINDMKAYDRFYQKLIDIVSLSDVSASFVMEEIKDSRAVPLEPL